MKTTDIASFCDDFFDYMNQVTEFNEVIKVNTEKGNAVILSEEEYKDLISAIELSN